MGHDHDPVLGQVAEGQGDVRAIELGTAWSGVRRLGAVGVGGRRIHGLDVRRRRACAARRVAQRRDVPDPLRGDREQEGIADRIVTDPADELDLAAFGGRAVGDRGGQPRPAAPPRADPDAVTSPMTTITREAYAPAAPLGRAAGDSLVSRRGRQRRSMTPRFARSLPRMTLIVPPLPLMSNVLAMTWSTMSVPPFPFSFTWPPGRR